jgi:hypothetical protein
MLYKSITAIVGNVPTALGKEPAAPVDNSAQKG